jgi:hypothetical protein
MLILRVDGGETLDVNDGLALVVVAMMKINTHYIGQAKW